MKLHRTIFPLAALASMTSGTVTATPVLNQWGTLASVASFDCATSSCDRVEDAFSALVTGTVGPVDGGVGQTSAAVAVGGPWPTPGSVLGSATVTGSLALPILKAGAASVDGKWMAGQALAVQAYTYNGPGETLGLTWNLTGTVDNAEGRTTTGLVVFAGFFDAATLTEFPDLSNFGAAVALLAELAAASPLDDFREYTAPGVVAESDSISLAVVPGQQFYLVMGLMAGAGGANAAVESLSTLTAGFSGAPSLTPASAVVPEPGSLALVALGLLGLGAARRRKAAA